MAEESRDEEEVVASEGEGQQGKEKPWYPYITKTQFEKFLSRLQSKIPEEIDRDYVRAIIRTPSMIYRFLRGVEAMGLIDDGQRPTDRLRSLVDKDTRRQAIDEVIQDLYPELLGKYQGSNGEMSDRDIVAFFRRETGMGNDSANKMKMFFKYLVTEAEGSSSAPAAEEAGEAADSKPADSKPADSKPADSKPADSKRQPARTAPRRRPGRPGRRGRRPPATAARARPGLLSRSSVAPRAAAAAPTAESAIVNGRGAKRERGERDRGASNRPLTEAQRAYLDTLKSVLRVNVDGDWDDDMIRLAFDRLERLFDRVRRN